MSRNTIRKKQKKEHQNNTPNPKNKDAQPNGIELSNKRSQSLVLNPNEDAHPHLLYESCPSGILKPQSAIEAMESVLYDPIVVPMQTRREMLHKALNPGKADVSFESLSESEPEPGPAGPPPEGCVIRYGNKKYVLPSPVQSSCSFQEYLKLLKAVPNPFAVGAAFSMFEANIWERVYGAYCVLDHLWRTNRPSILVDVRDTTLVGQPCKHSSYEDITSPHPPREFEYFRQGRQQPRTMRTVQVQAAPSLIDAAIPISTKFECSEHETIEHFVYSKKVPLFDVKQQASSNAWFRRRATRCINQRVSALYADAIAATEAHAEYDNAIAFEHHALNPSWISMMQTRLFGWWQQCTFQVSIPQDATMTCADILQDVFTHPIREIKAFLFSLLCAADNAWSLFDTSKIILLDPETNNLQTDHFILSKSAIRYLFIVLRQPAFLISRLATLCVTLAMAFTGDKLSALLSLAQALSIGADPELLKACAGHMPRLAAAFNLTKLLSFRQFCRFILVTGMLAMAWKVGGAVWESFKSLFRREAVGVSEKHSVGVEVLVLMVIGTLSTWLGRSFNAHCMTDFLRHSALVGGGQLLFNTFTDAATWVLRVVADFLLWIGLRSLSEPLNELVGRRTIAQLVRRGGPWYELQPRVHQFLSARTMGSTGPGSKSYVAEGREIVAEIDRLVGLCTSTPEGTTLLPILSRHRQSVVAAIEASLFTVESSNERIEPAFVQFCGGPRMGKTTFVTSLLNGLRRVYSQAESRDGLSRLTGSLAREGRWQYSRNSDDNFFSGYNRQAIIFYDDLWKSNNAGARNQAAQQRHDKEINEIHSLVSCQPYAPPMPEVGAGVPCPKGTFISPAWVVATSNIMLVNPQGNDPTIIDDRTHCLILVVERPGVAKDELFSHLAFFKLKVRVSELRNFLAESGWQTPYSFFEKQMPATLEEFREWNCKHMFEEVTPQQIIGVFEELHNQKIFELQVRRAASLKLSNAQRPTPQSELEESFETLCAELGLESPDMLHERLEANGLHATLQALRVSGHQCTLRHSHHGTILFHLKKGRLQPGHADAEHFCDCPGGHLSITLCPNWKDLVINFTMMEARTGSQPPPLNPVILGGDGLLKQVTPFKRNENVWEQFSRSICGYIGTDYVFSDMPEDWDRQFLVEDTDNCYVVKLNRFKKPTAFGIHVAGMQHAVLMTKNLTFISEPVGNVYYVPIPEQNSALTTVVQGTMLNIFGAYYYSRLFPHWQLSELRYSKKKSDFAEYCLLRADEIEPDFPTWRDIEELNRVIFMCRTVEPQVYKKYREQIEDDIVPCSMFDSVDLPKARAVWIPTFLDKLPFNLKNSALMQDDYVALKMKRIAESAWTNEIFEWRCLTMLLFTAEREITRAVLPFDWKFTRNDPTDWQGHPSEEYHIMVLEDHINHQVCRYDVRDGFPSISKVANDFLWLEKKTLYESLPCFFSTMNAFMPRRSFVDRLKEAGSWLLHLLRENDKIIIFGISAFAASYLFGSLMSVKEKISEGDVEEHSSGKSHRPGPRVISTNNWPDHLARYLFLIRHHGPSYKCKFCSQLVKPSHMHWDIKRMNKVMDDLISRNKQNPELDGWLQALVNANKELVRALDSSTFQQAANRVVVADRTGILPWTGNGCVIGFYVLVAWHCKVHRERARAYLTAQAARAIGHLGHRNPIPLPQASLDFPSTCKYEREELEECTYDALSCPHATAQETETHSTLPGSDNAVAAAASGSGFLLSSSRVLGRGYLAADGVIVTAAHVISDPRVWSPGEVAILHWRGQTRFDVVLSDASVMILPERDVAVIKSPAAEMPSRPFRDVITDRAPVFGSPASVVILNEKGGFDVEKVVLEPRGSANTPYHSIFMTKAFKPGDSGSLVIQGAHIIGHYHGVYRGTKGICCLWGPEVRKVVDSAKQSEFFDSRACQYVTPEGFSVLDEYPTSQFDSSPPTELRKTELFEPLRRQGVESVKYPASLTQEALAKAVSKWTPVDDTPDAAYAMSANELYSSHKAYFDLEGLTNEPFKNWNDCLNGRDLDADEGRVLKKVELKTSAGAPFCDLGIKKTDLIEVRGDTLFCKPELEAEIEKLHNSILAGDVAGKLATANLKDELRDIERVKQKKTRLFCATPLHHNIIFRKYFGRWISHFKHMPLEMSMHAMGRDVYGDDWSEIIDYLESVAPAPDDVVYLAGDFSRFDTSHSGWKLRQAFKVASSNASDETICEAVGLTIGRFAMRYGDREFRVPAGLPSGCQMTTPINCILNQLLWLAVWRKIHGTGLSDFKKHCRLIVYGDDVVLAMNRRDPKYGMMKPQVIQKLMKSLGYDLTGADDEDLQWVTRDRVTFLKRRFERDSKSGLLHCPRPIEEVMTQIMWRRSEYTPEAQECCFRMLAMELGQFPPNERKHWYDRLVAALRECPENIRRDFANSDFVNVMSRAWKHEHSLDDLTQLRAAFWRLF